MPQRKTEFDLYMLPAENGDCLWLEYDSKGARKRVLIDCGTEGSWPVLKERILQLPEGERHFDLLVITHIDDDHIGGALPLLHHRLGLGLTFGEIWFNDHDRIVGTGLGVGQGIVLSTLLGGDNKLRKVWNLSVKCKAIRTPDLKPGRKLPTFSFGELELTVLSPTTRQLTRLKNKWDQVVAELSVMTANDSSYTHKAEKWLGRSDINAFAPRKASLDRSVPNGSSIAFLATYRGRSLLFGADAFAPTLLKSMNLVQPAPSTVGFKLSHHGSIANLTAPLLAAAKSRHYLISTSGAVHNHPHVQTLDMLTAGDTLKTLHFNYRAKHVIDWINKHPSGPGQRYIARFVDETGYRVELG
jgi:beta-lactamase superfamily II metal-dependent hydrolase